MTAQEARELTTKSLERRVQAIDESISIMAERGYNFVTVSKTEFDEKIVEEITKKYTNLGYNVAASKDFISITW